MGKRSGFIRITLKEPIVEERSDISFFARSAPLDLWGVLKAIETGSESKRVNGLLLIVKSLNAGWAQTEELDQAITRFRKRGKKVFAYLENADNRSYYLASNADRLYVPPSATLDFIGLRAEILFFKNLLDSLGIEPQLLSLGEYKSAGEVFMRTDMSEANRRMTDSLLTDIQERLKSKVALHRGVDAETVQTWIDGGPYTARRALEIGLVDGLDYDDEVEASLRKELPDCEEIGAQRLESKDGFLKRWITFYRPQIAVVFVEGIILAGESHRGRGGRKTAGADDIVSFLRSARKNKRIKAIVLRVNSPGGSALASDLIWREVKRTNSEKPVVVSFGNVAASGGYYIAAAGRKILSSPSTLTGSIGVLGGKFSIGQFLERWGITVDIIEKGAHSGYSSMTRGFSASEEEAVRDQLRDFYEDLFLPKVAEGRALKVDEVRRMAEGRVWTGAQGVEGGLVDEVGGLVEAVETARESAGLRRGQRFRMVRYSRRRRLLDLLPGPWFSTLTRLPLTELRGERLALMADELDIQ